MKKVLAPHKNNKTVFLPEDIWDLQIRLLKAEGRISNLERCYISWKDLFFNQLGMVIVIVVLFILGTGVYK